MLISVSFHERLEVPRTLEAWAGRAGHTNLRPKAKYRNEIFYSHCSS
jgi:hypothetical protein